jgi:alpha-tubulin suppressor-like RCC1 family protein
MAIQITGGANIFGGTQVYSYTPPPPYRLYAWGNNAIGQLATGNTSSYSTPTQEISGGTTWNKISMGWFSGAGIKTDGTLWTWGNNGNAGNLGQGVSGPNTSSPATVAGGGTWTAVAAGGGLMAAIKTDGTLWGWGYNGSGNFSSPVSSMSGTWTAVAAQQGTALALKSDGTIWGWGHDDYGQLGRGTPGSTESLSAPVQVAASQGSNFAVLATCSYNTSAAIKKDGTLWSWGFDHYGECGSGSATAYPYRKPTPTQVAGGGTTWARVAFGTNHAVAVKTDGTLWTWGQNNYGQLGDGTTTNRSSPGTVAGGGTTWSTVSATTIAGALGATMAIKTDGTLWTWGQNNVGQLGNGSTVDTSTPGIVPGGITSWTQVASNYLNGVIGIHS